MENQNENESNKGNVIMARVILVDLSYCLKII